MNYRVIEIFLCKFDLIIQMFYRFKLAFKKLYI